MIGHAGVIRLPICSRNGAMQAIFRSSLAILAFASLFSAIYSSGQAPAPIQPATSQTTQEPDKTQGKKGTVILSRSIDENGQTIWKRSAAAPRSIRTPIPAARRLPSPPAKPGLPRSWRWKTPALPDLHRFRFGRSTSSSRVSPCGTSIADPAQ